MLLIVESRVTDFRMRKQAHRIEVLCNYAPITVFRSCDNSARVNGLFRLPAKPYSWGFAIIGSSA